MAVFCEDIVNRNHVANCACSEKLRLIGRLIARAASCFVLTETYDYNRLIILDSTKQVLIYSFSNGRLKIRSNGGSECELYQL